MLQKVATMGVNLDRAYAQTLQRIRDQKGSRSRLGMEVLMWVSYAERPLRIDELCHALAVEIGSTDLDTENISPEDTVLGSCLGLAVVHKETSTVRLIHYTLQEYLSQPSVFPDAHRTLGQTCLTYLNYDQVKCFPASYFSSPAGMPFLEYASLHWGRHARIELSDYAKSLALELLNRYERHISSCLLFKKICNSFYSPPSHGLFTGLHCASYFGIDEVMAALVEIEGCDINQGDWLGFTPLMWAARQGSQGAVTILLTREDTDPDKVCNRGRTPLWWTSRNGHEGVVRLLLARSDVNPEKPDNIGATPLLAASSHGREGVVRLLLARDDVNPDKPNNYGQTPLWAASSNGHEGVVRLLLARDDVNPDKPNYYGETPLWGASRGGHEGVVKLLLARNDVNPDKPDSDGRTPLRAASECGHEGVVKLLLARGNANSDKPDNDSSIPPHCASSNQHEPAVRPAVAGGDITLDQPASRDQTPPGISSLCKRRQSIAEPFPQLSGKRRREN